MEHQVDRRNSAALDAFRDGLDSSMSDAVTATISTFDGKNETAIPPAVAHFYCLCPKVEPSRHCNLELCDTVLTFNDTTNHHYNIPGSTWTTARNAMYYLAKKRIRFAKMQNRSTERYFCFMDGDTTINTPKQTVLDQLSKETEFHKIIALNYRKAYTGAKYMTNADANLNCFAMPSIDTYLPYSTLKDTQAWYLAQTDLHLRANIIEPFVFKIYDNIVVRNPTHNNNYPRNGTQGIQELLNAQLKEGFSNGCFPSYVPELAKLKHEIQYCYLKNQFLFSWTKNDTHRW